MACVLGVDLGGTKIQVALFEDPAGEPLATAKRATPTEGGPPDVAAEIVATAREAVEAAGRADLTAVGLGSPGVIDHSTGEVTAPGNLPGWQGTFLLGPAIAEALGVPVRVDNDVNLGALAEWKLGAGRGYGDLLVVFCGTGVGGGLILDGALRRGPNGAAGEVGHVIVDAYGPRCTCGARGCMEAFTGRWAIERDAAKHPKGRLAEEAAKRGRLTSGGVARALAAGDRRAEELVDRAAWALGVALASSSNLLDLDALVVGGGLAGRLGQPFLAAAEKHMRPLLFASVREVPLLAATLGDLAGARGAALLVYE